MEALDLVVFGDERYSQDSGGEKTEVHIGKAIESFPKHLAKHEMRKAFGKLREILNEKLGCNQ